MSRPNTSVAVPANSTGIVSVLRERRPAVILGVAPGAKGQPAWSPDAPTTVRLADLAGLQLRDLPRAYALDNLVPYPDPGRTALREAGQLYQFLPGFWYVLAGYDVLRALGKRVRAKKTSALPYYAAGPAVLQWYESAEGVVLACLPHPSGRNHWYNETANRRAAEKFLRETAGGGGKGKAGAHAQFLAARAAADKARAK